MSKLLYRLPDGTHIDLANIALIRPVKESVISPGSLLCVAIYVGERIHCIDQPSYEAAQEYADHLATLVNEAREDQRPSTVLPYAIPVCQMKSGSIDTAISNSLSAARALNQPILLQWIGRAFIIHPTFDETLVKQMLMVACRLG